MICVFEVKKTWKKQKFPLLFETHRNPLCTRNIVGFFYCQNKTQKWSFEKRKQSNTFTTDRLRCVQRVIIETSRKHESVTSCY